MGGPVDFCIRFSGLTIRFSFPAPLEIPEALDALRCEDTDTPDAHYQIVLIHHPLRPTEPLYHEEQGVSIYQTEKGWLRIYSGIMDTDGCQVACLFSPDGRHTLYCPASRWLRFYSGNAIVTFLCGELLLLQHNALLLHSSLVMLHGKAILFCGPSGAGKSTQAQLWEQHLGAQILNGDRTVVMKRSDGFYGGGSLWSGTSGIYRSEQAPIAGIFLVGQAPETTIRPLGFDAFVPLYSQTILNSWDPAFMSRISGLFSDLLAQVPIYRLNCLPDEGAVKAAYDTLFGNTPL